MKGVSHENLGELLTQIIQSPARLPENLDVRKKFPSGELNMLVKPSDSWLLILQHANHQAENSSVFSRHVKVIHKVTLSLSLSTLV
jgi:hypothetical protein